MNNSPTIRAKYYIGGLSVSTTVNSLHAYFLPFAQLNEINLKRDRFFAFVTFLVHSTAEAVNLQANLTNATHTIDGNVVSVTPAIPRSQLTNPVFFVTCPECHHCFPASHQK
jgi:RNA recognition motif. (a.k.a. RRM, RBD, or RNP domain)